MSASALRLLRGRVVDGRYLLDEWIGGGSFGGVFLAGEYVDDRRLRTVAVKLLPAEPGDAGEAQCRELEVSLNLDHPHLLRCFSAGRCGVEGFDVLYLTMEVAEGSLEARLQESRLSESETRELALSLASALSHLHAKNLVHRDVKPGNVLKVGDAWKLADFGSVRAVEKSTAQASKNIGTASYAPPEAYEGSVSSAWDVWSLGCLLQEAATGVLPFVADTPTGLMHRVLTGDPAIPADLPSWLDALVRSCLKKERSQRPSAIEVAARWEHARPTADVSHEFAVIVAEKLRIAPELVTMEYLKGIRSLDLSQIQISDDCLLQLNGLNKLQELYLWSTQVTDAGLEHLKCLTGLQKLVLTANPISGPGLEHLKNLAELRVLYLGRTQVSDAGLVHLKSLTGLRVLYLGRTQVSDAGLEHLMNMTGLQVLHLGDTRVSVAGIEQVRMALPRCDVYAQEGNYRSVNRQTSTGLVATPIRLLNTLEGHTGMVWSVAFSPDGRTLASVGWDRAVRLWDMSTGGQLRTLKGHSGWANSIAFSPDGRILASGSNDRTARLWDVGTSGLLRTLEAHTGGVLSVAFSPDGRILATGGDRTVRLWDAATGRLLRTLKGHKESVRSVAFSPDGRTVASCGDDKIACLWDTDTGRRMTLKGHEGWVWSLAFSPDGRTLATGSWDYRVRVWDIATGRLLNTLEGHDDGVNAVMYAPDGKSLVSGGKDKTVRLWDTADGRLLQTLSGHAGGVYSVAFSPDGRTLASGGDDRTVRLWGILRN